jgi:hypothetical protein
MKIEQFVETVTNNPSFWVRVWLFFFLLVNRKEGKELVRQISEKLDKTMEKADSLHEKANLLLEKAGIATA